MERAYRESKMETDPFSEGFKYGWGSTSTYFPYWKYLHTSILPTMWDEVCKVNPDILSLMCSEPLPFFQFMANSSTPWTIPLGLTVNHHMYDLTALTQVQDMFRFQAAFHVQSSLNGAPIIFNSGASITLTPHLSDFVGKLDTSPAAIGGAQVFGLSSKSIIKGVGTIRLLVHTDTGARRYIETLAYYVPDSQVCLLSVCHYMESYHGEGCFFAIDDKGCCFRFPRSQGGGDITFNFHGTNYIPRTTAYSQQFGKSGGISSSSKETFMVLDNENVNLTLSQKELLKWHFCLGHLNMRWIQKLFTRKILTTMETQISSKNALCNCMACKLAKQMRRPDGTTCTQVRPEKDGGLKKNILRPGAMVSSDQFVSSVPGRLPNTYGKEREDDKYSGGTIFVDKASGYVGIYNQVSLGAAETIKSKHRFERDAVRHGLLIQGYRADNGIYQSKEFKDDLNKFAQTIQFCGVGAHHGNGIAECAIRTVSDSAHAILLHAMIHWPKHISLDLWPFAVKYVVYLYNCIPRGSSDLLPLELFFDIKSDYQDLRSAKVWGCPAYVLDPKIHLSQLASGSRVEYRSSRSKFPHVPPPTIQSRSVH